VVEGPNNVGKTTFINKLANELPCWQIEHLTGDCPNDVNFYDHILSDKRDVILDRCHVGEMIYPQIYERVPKLTEEEFYSLCDKHKDHVIYVFIDAETAFIYRSCKNKNEEFVIGDVLHEKFEFDGYCMDLTYRGCKVYRFTNRITNEYATDCNEETVLNNLIKEVMT
jgi:thymidylate kinase